MDNKVSIISSAITLLLVMDPFGNIPPFLSLLSHIDGRRRKLIIIREMLIAFAILMLFLFFGDFILKGMHITEPALSIAGGVILFLIAIKMIFPEQTKGSSFSNQGEDPLIVPLAVPLVAGPSAMVLVTLLSTRYPEERIDVLFSVLIAWGVTATILVLADFLGNLLGPKLLKAIERLMGMILTTMATQMLLSGIEEYLTAIGMLS